MSPVPELRVAIAASVSGPSDADFVVQAERLGAGTVYVAEAWGSDALTPLAYLAARTTSIRLATGIAQIGARTPAMLAMSAVSMQSLSGGRFVLGLGTSGPQVMEGWHGVRFRAPVQTTRETIEIVRQIARGERLSHRGTVYQLPLPDGPGRSIRSLMPPVTVPVHVAALGPQNLRLAGEVADGWIGNAFMPETAEAFLAHLGEGAARAGRTLADVELVIPVSIEFTEDIEGAARRHARGYAFTMGAMGSRSQNFYNAAFERQGFGEDVEAVQSLWLAGEREKAAERVPLEIGLRTNLIGTPSMVKDRLRLYRAAGINTLQAKTTGHGAGHLDVIAELIDLVDEVNREN